MTYVRLTKSHRGPGWKRGQKTRRALSNRPLFAMWGVMPGGARWPAEFVEREHSPVRKERVAEVAEPEDKSKEAGQ